jgi:hypothetical protein
VCVWPLYHERDMHDGGASDSLLVLLLKYRPTGSDGRPAGSHVHTYPPRMYVDTVTWLGGEREVVAMLPLVTRGIYDSVRCRHHHSPLLTAIREITQQPRRHALSENVYLAVGRLAVGRLEVSACCHSQHMICGRVYADPDIVRGRSSPYSQYYRTHSTSTTSPSYSLGERLLDG